MSIQADQPGAKDQTGSEDEDNKKGEIGANTTGPQTIGGTPGNIGGSGGGAGGGGIGAQAAGKTPTSSGAFTDVGKYLDANRANAGQFAKKTASGFQGKVQTVANDAEAAQQETIGNVNNQRLDSTKFEGKSASEIAPGFGQGVDLPTDNTMVQSRNDAARMQGMSDTLDTMGGRSSYLREELSPTIDDYSVGENRLDTLMTMGNSDANQVYKDAGAEAYALDDTIGNLETGITDAVTDVTGFNENVMGQYRDHLGNLRSGIDTDMGNQSGSRSDAVSGTGDRILQHISRQNQPPESIWNPDPLNSPYVQVGDNGPPGSSGMPTTTYGGPSGNTAWQKYKTETGGTDTTGYSAEQIGELQALDALMGNDKQTYKQYDEAAEKAAYSDWLKENYGDIDSAGYVSPEQDRINQSEAIQAFSPSTGRF